MSTQKKSKARSKRSKAPGETSEDESLSAFEAKVDAIKAKWDRENGTELCKTVGGTEWSSQGWSDNFKAAFHSVAWEEQSKTWKSGTINWLTDRQGQDIYKSDFPSIERFLKSRKVLPVPHLALDDKGLSWLQTIIKQDFESLVRRKTLESPPDQASIRGECRRLLLEIAKLLNMVDTKYGCGRLHRLSVFAENVLSMRDKTASTEVYVVLKACKEIVSLTRDDKFAIPTSAVVAYYIPRIEVIKEAAGEAVAEVNSQAKSKINARNSSKQAISEVLNDDASDYDSEERAGIEREETPKRAYTPVSRRASPNDGPSNPSEPSLARAHFSRRIENIALHYGSYRERFHNEGGEALKARLFELWKCFHYGYNEELDWLIAGLESLLDREPLLPNPKTIPRSKEELEMLWEITRSHKEKTPHFGYFDHWRKYGWYPRRE